MVDETNGETKTIDTGAAMAEAGKTSEQTLLGAKTDETKVEDKKDETKTEVKTDDKSAEKKDDKAAPTVDPKAFKLPDGFTADEKQLGEFAAVANEFKLPQEAAQKLVDMHVNALKTASEASSKYWADKQAEWLAEAKTTYGPEPAKNPKIIAVSKLIDSLGEKPAAALKEALDMSGMGNNPAVIAAFTALAERLTEPGHAKGSPPAKPQDPAQAFYPNMKQG